MIERKNKKQKDQDQKHLVKCAHACAAAVKTFTKEVWESEFRLEWIYLSTINKMQEASDAYAYAKKRVKEEYTFTDIDEDHKHEHWQNSTDIDKYDN